MGTLLDDRAVAERVLGHIEAHTTDMSEGVWREPVENYRSPERLAAEIALLRRCATPFCPSAALPEAGSYVARQAGGRPLVVVRDADGRARAYLNVCRHRGTELVSGSGCTKAFVCRYHGWNTLTNRGDGERDPVEAAERDTTFVNQTGAAEDLAIACAIQRGIASGANEFFTYGRFEGAIAHFHRSLDAALGV